MRFRKLEEGSILTLEVMRPLTPSIFPVASLGGGSAVHGGTPLLLAVEGLGTLPK